MTVKQVQELYYISNGEGLDFEKSIQMVGVLSGKTPEKVEKMKMPEFNRYCQRINKQFEVIGKKYQQGKPRRALFVNGRLYHLRYDVRYINAAMYVEALQFSGDVISNMHKIMATIAQPINIFGKPVKRLHEDIAKDMEDIDFETAYHAAVFFYTLFQISMKNIQPYLIREAVKKGAKAKPTAELLERSLKILDGFTMPNWSQNLKAYLWNRYGI